MPQPGSAVRGDRGRRHSASSAMPRYKTAQADPGTGTLPRRYDQLGWRTPQASFACSTILVGSLDPLVAVLRLTKNCWCPHWVKPTRAPRFMLLRNTR